VQELTGAKSAEGVRMMSGFGGGIGGMGSVCGAIIGGVAALSAKYGHGRIEEQESPKLFSLCAELYRRFGSEVEESHFCRDITGTDFTNPEEVKAYFASPERVGRCRHLIEKTVEITREIILREEAQRRRQRQIIVEME
jgi:C_GCAxxG_C_C family probable redox protein